MGLLVIPKTHHRFKSMYFIRLFLLLGTYVALRRSVSRAAEQDGVAVVL